MVLCEPADASVHRERIATLGSLFNTLDIARSGLQAAQIELNVAGHNISNVNKEGYSRQRVTLTNRNPERNTFGQLGRGVEVSDVSRVREAFLDTIYRQQLQRLQSAQVRASYFTSVEDLFQEPDTNGFGTRLSDFFGALDDFSNNVEEQAVRTSVVTEAQNLAASLNQVAEEIYALRTNANEEVKNTVPEINSLASQIASLNVTIQQEESGGHKANDLRDERDLALDKLSQLVDITYRERGDTMVDVFVGGEVLVAGEDTRQVVAQQDSTLDPARSDLVTVQFADSGKALDISGGSIYGALMARDTDLKAAGARIDDIAAAIIREVNTVQSTGNGIQNLSGTISGTNAVTDAATPLSSAGLPFDVTNGSFDVIVYDASGNPTTSTVTITDTTTLDSLAASLNGIANFSASVGSDRTLSLGATGTNTFSFANDTSGALTALGINGVFTGHDAASIAVSTDIAENPLLLSSGYSTDIKDTGDNTAALALANIRNNLVFDNGTATIQNYYESTIVRVGVDARANSQTLDVQQTFVDDFNNRRQEVSGVSIDEEVTYMLQYQRAYEASARVITVVDRMLDALMAMGS